MATLMIFTNVIVTVRHNRYHRYNPNVAKPFYLAGCDAAKSERRTDARSNHEFCSSSPVCVNYV
jgi:hypothetical protein